MRILANSGHDRLLDLLRSACRPGDRLDLAASDLSLFGFSELRDALALVSAARLVVPAALLEGAAWMGGDGDRAYRNRLEAPWLARQLREWLARRSQVRATRGGLDTALAVVADGPAGVARVVASGASALSTGGLGLTPPERLSMVMASESEAEAAAQAGWFDRLWSGLPESAEPRARLLDSLATIAADHPPSLVYFATLFHLFRDLGAELDEERIIKSATGIHDSTVWKKLFRFQRDGVVGAIDKLERFGGCVLADSVGLGKTFEALAIIRYYELRNDRVLVLCPKRLRDNWTLYRSNDRRNVLAADRFHYDVLNHTDLSRDGGVSGDIDLSYVNWGNYDLVVIDESHNFRNKKTPHKDRETRYDRLMRQIIREGVKTRVLMLSATPVNNRLADIKNQIAFITEGNDGALAGHGIPSVEATVRLAQQQFNRWLTLDEQSRRPARLLDMLGFDYFRLLDLLTIARSRKHIERYYGTNETGRFPERLAPVNIKADVDLRGEFQPIARINDEIRSLNLAAYAPLRYLLDSKREAYDRKYATSVKGGAGMFRQQDREESLVQLLRVNMLKRMESSVHAFALTLERQLADADALLSRLESSGGEVEELSIDDVEIDDPQFEALLVGNKVKVLLQDVDRIRWKQELLLDRNRLHTLLSAARQVDAARDAKLAALREVIASKCEAPINGDNRKILLFTASTDTAEYLYGELAPWARARLGLESALVTGGGKNRCTLPSVGGAFGGILSAFSPRSKERPAELASDGEVDLLIATDCISEGQNLQDCDYLINYDIHWNPVRIIQRFGRIDRIGSANARIQLVNFWPNMELEEYIGLEQKVGGKMVLLDISATGEENLLEREAGDQMNDLEYRRKQLLRLQHAVIDLEDLSSGVSIADLTLNDFRVDLARYLREHPGRLASLPLGVRAVTTSLATPGNAGAVDASGDDEGAIPPGILFCLRAAGEAGRALAEPGYPLAPHFLVHVGEDGAVLLPHARIKHALDRWKRLCLGRDLPEAGAVARFHATSEGGRDMRRARELLGAAIASILDRREERDVASLFDAAGSHALPGETAGGQEFEVVSYLVVLPPDGEPAPGAADG